MAQQNQQPNIQLVTGLQLVAGELKLEQSIPQSIIPVQLPDNAGNAPQKFPAQDEYFLVIRVIFLDL
nr:5955_t:CDS:2 [Entrophospora candida]